MCTPDFTRVSFFPREYRLVQWKSWKQDWQKYIQKQKFEVTSENEKESNKINLFAALLLSLSSSLTISKIRKEEVLGTRLQQNYCYKTSKKLFRACFTIEGISFNINAVIIFLNIINSTTLEMVLFVAPITHNPPISIIIIISFP